MSVEAEALKMFLNTDPQQLADDLATAPEKIDSILKWLKNYDAIPLKARTVEQIAKHYHYSFLRDHVRVMLPSSEQDDLLLYAVCREACHIAEEAGSSASVSPGELSQLCAKLREMDKRDGLKEGESRRTCDAPEDYQQLAEKSDQLWAQIEDTVFLQVLAMYGFTEYANLYENNRMLYDVRFIAGLSMVWKFVPPDNPLRLFAPASGDDYLRKKHGQEAVDLVHKRLAAFGRRFS